LVNYRWRVDAHISNTCITAYLWRSWTLAIVDWNTQAQRLVEMLSCNKSLIELTIGESVIHEAGLSELAKGLLQNTSLQILNIDEYTTRAKIERINRHKIFSLHQNTPLGCEFCVIHSKYRIVCNFITIWLVLHSDKCYNLTSHASSSIAPPSPHSKSVTACAGAGEELLCENTLAGL